MDVLKMIRGIANMAPGGSISALAGALGIEDMTELERDQLPTAFQDAAKQSQKSGARVLRMRGRFIDGSEMCGLIVLSGDVPALQGKKESPLLCPESVNAG